MRRPNHVARAAAFQQDAQLARWILALVLLALFVADVLVPHAVFTSRFPGANDFYSRWGGARSWWTQGLSPYSEATSIQIEIGIYGRRALPGEDPGLFAYPFYTVFVLAPLAFLPYVWAEAAWLAALVAASRDLARCDVHPLVCVLLINALVIPFAPQSTMRVPLGMLRLIVGLVAAVITWCVYRQSRRALNCALLRSATLVFAFNESQLPN